MEKWIRSKYQPNLPLYPGKYVTCCDEHIAISLEAAREGMVLLKNEKKLLPLSPGGKVALFGKGTFDYVKGGGGSGDVYTRYIRNLYDGIKVNNDAEIFEPLADYYRRNVEKQYADGAEPGMTVEPELPADLMKEAAAFCDTAIISISRFSGEGWDRSDVVFKGEYSPWPDRISNPEISGQIFPDGDFYLSPEEKAMVASVTASFPKVIVVLNVGGMVDTSWIKGDEAIGAALLAWQGGMEGGLAAADILFGRVNPSGKLPDTFTGSVQDYPSTEHFHDSFWYVDYTEDIYVGYRYFETLPGQKNKIVYPFGYGLSYTNFDVSVMNADVAGDPLTVTVKVRNVGSVPGKEVVQVYAEAPQGKLGKAKYVLVGFQKTKRLDPGEEEIVTIRFDRYGFASFDDTGAVCKYAYVLEKGGYRFHIGTGLHNIKAADSKLTLEEDQILVQLKEELAPTSLSKRLRADGTWEELPTGQPNDPNACVLTKMVPGTEEGLEPAQRYIPRAFRFTLTPPIQLKDVVDGKATLDEFMAQLTDEELIHLLGGQPNTTVANTYGMGNLPEYGVPNIMTADGPAGLRIHPHIGIATTAFPCGTLLTSTWNPEIVEKVGAAGGAEVKENNIAMWLTPAINIHRNPMCGRNFEYYSEDPYLAGIIGAAMVRGIQSNGVSACVKHFAVNNKETNRKQSDSRLSQRALREIYLKAFEIVVKTADPWAIMSSYNIINGHRASECKDLLEDILRGEWGFQGMVTTDWWTRGEHYKEILAGNDVKMGCGFPERVVEAQNLGAITRADYEHCARRILEMIMKLD